MQTILSICDTASVKTSPLCGLLPTPINIAIHLLNRIHWVWRWNFTFTQVVGNSTNLKKYIAGHILSFVAGDFIIVRVAAQVVLIVTRLYDLGYQKVQTYYAFCALYDAALIHPISVKVELPADSLLKDVLGNSSYLWIRKESEKVKIYCTRVALAAIELLKQMFYTSMCYMDVIEAFTINPEVTNTAINHIFVNSSRMLDEMSENKQHIYATLKRYKGLVEEILVSIGSPCNADTLISTVKKTLTVAQWTKSTMDYVWDGSKEIVNETALGASYVLGLPPPPFLLDNQRRPEVSGV